MNDDHVDYVTGYLRDVIDEMLTRSDPEERGRVLENIVEFATEARDDIDQSREMQLSAAGRDRG